MQPTLGSAPLCFRSFRPSNGGSHCRCREPTLAIYEHHENSNTAFLRHVLRGAIAGSYHPYQPPISRRFYSSARTELPVVLSSRARLGDKAKLEACLRQRLQHNAVSRAEVPLRVTTPNSTLPYNCDDAHVRQHALWAAKETSQLKC